MTRIAPAVATTFDLAQQQAMISTIENGRLGSNHAIIKVGGRESQHGISNAILCDRIAARLQSLKQTLRNFPASQHSLANKNVG